jgi:cytochrome d ubiquinol oxidase subunit II
VTGLWYANVAAMLAIYVVLDGFDFGAGIVHLFVARTEAERRQVLAAIGPVWDGNEVWLIAAGGTLFFAFPKAYAISFSGFYLPLMLVLWLLILRGVSIEFRAQVPGALWRAFWDAVFALSGLALAIVLGAALGNVLRGVGLDGSGAFATPLFGNFRANVEQPGVLDWYTIGVGVFTAATLASHGLGYLRWKTSGEVQRRCAKAALPAWILVALLFVIGTFATARVRPELFSAIVSRPWSWLFVALAWLSLIAAPIAHRRGAELAAFLCSSVFLGSVLAATACGLYPVLLPSAIDPRFSLNAHSSASGAHGLAVGIVWWTAAMLLAAAYFTYLFRSLRGKIAPAELTSENHL